MNEFESGENFVVFTSDWIDNLIIYMHQITNVYTRLENANLKAVHVIYDSIYAVLTVDSRARMQCHKTEVIALIDILDKKIEDLEQNLCPQDIIVKILTIRDIFKTIIK